MKRRFYRAVIMMAILVAAVDTAPAAGFHFAVLGDRAGGPDQAVFEQVVGQMTLLSPDLVVTVGDQVEGDADSAAMAKDWDVVLATLKQLPCPVTFAAGNNDSFDETSRKLFQEKTGKPPYFSFDAGESHFVVLDNSLTEFAQGIDKTQLAWLEKDLAAATSPMIFVLMHKPFFADAVEKNQPDPLHRILKRYPVKAVFAGHWHQYSHAVKDGIDYFLVGSSGARIEKEQPLTGEFYHFLWCTVDNGRFSATVVRLGCLLPVDTVTLDETTIAWRIDRDLVGFTLPLADDRPAATASLKLSITNPLAEPLRAKAKISCGANWIMTPAELDLSLAAGSNGTYLFTGNCSGQLFPLPRLVFDMPLGHGKLLPYDQPVVLVKTVTCPVIKRHFGKDAAADQASWQRAAWLSEFGDMAGNATTAPATRIGLLHDRRHLFIRAECDDPRPESLAAVATERDQEVYKDDCVGLLLTAGNGVIVQYYVNLAGTIFDLRIEPDKNLDSVEWNGGIVARPVKLPGGYRLDLAIPFTDLGLKAIKTGQTLRLNLRRRSPSHKGDAVWIPGAWNIEPGKYGTVVLQ